MKRLSRHIEYLLHAHDVLALPGVGTFHVHHLPAVFEKSTGRFIPPYAEIGFDNSVANEDGHLLNSYQRQLQISYEVASETLEKDLADLMDKIRQGGAELEGIGTLNPSADNESINFLPFGNRESRAQMEGLPVISIKKSEENVVEGDHDGKDTRKFDPRYYYIRIHKKVARLAASFLLVALVGVFAFLPYDSSKKPTTTASIVPVETEIIETVSKPEIAQPKPADAEPMDIREGKKHYLIVGAFRSREEAKKFEERITDDKYELELLKDSKHYYLSAGGSDVKQELVDRMRDEEFRTAFSQSWIWGK